MEILFAAEPMGDFVFPSVVGYTDVLEVSFTLFPWSETLWSMLAVSSRPPGNTRVACVPLAGTLKVTVGEQAAGAPRVTPPWGLSEFQPPSARMSCPHCQPQGSSSFSSGKENPQSLLAGIRGYDCPGTSVLT